MNTSMTQLFLFTRRNLFTLICQNVLFQYIEITGAATPRRAGGWEVLGSTTPASACGTCDNRADVTLSGLITPDTQTPYHVEFLYPPRQKFLAPPV